MTVFARQIAPEDQESPLFYDFPDNIAVCGNHYFIDRGPDIFFNTREFLWQGILTEVLEYPQNWTHYYKNEVEAIIDYFPPQNRNDYTKEEINALRSFVLDFSCCARSHEDDILCKVLSIVDGKRWDYKTIRGCTQSDWQKAYFPVAEWSAEDLKAFEVEYFNMGSEWIIDEGNFDPELDDPENIFGSSVYCTGDDVKQEIAACTGESQENIILYAFDGYTRTAKYKQV